MSSKNTIVSYFLKFSKETAEQLHKACNDSISRPNQKTRYYVMPEGGTKITIQTYEDWLNGEFNELYDNGKILIPNTKPKK